MELVKSHDVINRALEMQVKDLSKNMKGAPVDSRFVKELPLVQAQGDPLVWLQGIKAEPHLKSQEIIVVSGTTRDRPEDMTIVMNALGKALEDENMSSEEQQHHKLIEQAQAKQVEGSARLEQKRKLLGNRQKNGDDELAKKTLDRLEAQLSDNGKTLGTLRLDAISVESQIKSLQTHMNNADVGLQVSPARVVERSRQERSLPPLRFTSSCRRRSRTSTTPRRRRPIPRSCSATSTSSTPPTRRSRTTSSRIGPPSSNATARRS